MSSVTLTNLCKSFKDVTAVKDVNLEIADREFLVLVGPSGCGKTTALRMIAGLEDITSGKISIDGRIVNDVSPKDRDIAMVFQNYALYPHMTVFDNMAFGLRLRRTPGLFGRRVFTEKQIGERVNHAAEILDLKVLLLRKPKELSGGQRQRVALGRAIVREPKVFLMDEPLSNLDAKLRVQTRAELIKLHRRLGITTIYVTHDQIEAMTMGDRIVVMKDGLVQQVDTPLGLYHHPVNKFVAGFIGSPAMNFVPGLVRTVGDQVVFESDSFKVLLPRDLGERVRARLSDGDPGEIGVRPEEITVHSEPGSALTSDRVATTVRGATTERAEGIRATVDVVEPMGAVSLLYLTCGTESLIASVDAETPAKEGHVVDVRFDTKHLQLFDSAGVAL